ncbi:hypothetical protein [Massilia sp. 9096]|nr:hypothetical protein [Massilia sp. 9096]
MIAYRSQYEPMDRALAKMVREKKLARSRNSARSIRRTWATRSTGA